MVEINKEVFNSFPELDSERLILREILPEDAEIMFELRTDDDVMLYMDTYKMKSIEDADKLITSLSESFKKGAGINWGLVDKREKVFIGYFGIWRIDEKNCRGEIGYALLPKYWGKGFMQEAFNVLLPYAFRELNLHSLEGNVNPDNLASIKVLEKAGFRKEAYFRENFLFDGQFKDSIIYSLLEKDMK